VTVEIVFFLKPDAVIRRYVGARTLKTLLDKISNLEFLYFGEIQVAKTFLAEEHYVEHKGKFFYEWLVNYVASTPIVFSIVKTKEENVEAIRKILGPTIPEKAAIEAPNTIRAMYGIMGGVNVAHASDAVETARRESGIWKKYLNRQGIKVENKGTSEIINDVLRYIETYIDYPMIDTIRYRELLLELKEGRADRSTVENKIAELLAKEADKKFIDNNYHKALSKIFIENIMLKR